MDSASLKPILIRVSIVSGVVILMLIGVAVAQRWSKGKPGPTLAKKQQQPATAKSTDGATNAASELMAAAQSAAASATEQAAEADPFQTTSRQTPTPAKDRYADYYDQAAEAVNDAATQVAEGAADFAQEATEQFVPVTPVAETDAALAAESPSAEEAADDEHESVVKPADERYPHWSQDENTPPPATAQVDEEMSAVPDAGSHAADDRSVHEDETDTSVVEDHAPVESAAESEPLAPVEPRRWDAEATAETPLDNGDVENQTPPMRAAESAPRTAPSRLQSAALGAGVPGDPQLETEQGAALVIHKTGPPEVQLGIETTYEIRVQNVGDAPAHDVEVHDVAPRGADLVATQPNIAPGANGELIWALGTLAPGEEVTVQMRVTPRTEGEIGSVARVYFSADAAVRTLVTRPQLELTVEAPKSVLAGERAQFFVRVTNTGTGVATGLVLEEIVPAGFAHPAGASLEYRVGTLKPRESRELPLTLSAVKPIEAVNVVTARADGDILVEQRTAVKVVAPALEVEMQGPRRRFLDRDATYTVAVKNPGTAPAKEIELVTFLAPGMEFVAADSAGQYDPETRAVYWLLDELPPNEMGNVSVTARPTKPGEHVLRVEGRAQRGLEDIEEQAIVVEGLAAVEFQVIDLADPVEINGEAAYEIVVKNGGTKAAENVELMALLPVEMQLIAADGPTRHKIAGQKLSFEPIGSLAPGATATFQLTAKTVDAGDARLQVKLITAEMESPVTKEENTKVFGDE